jgi:AraC-like DNA-binding protein
MDNGINIPEQVSIIGTDCDEMESKIANIAISSIDIQPFQLGKQCAEILLTSHGNGQQNKKLFSELKLVSKSSTLRSNKFNDIVNLAIYYINAYYSAGIKVSDVTEYCGVSRKTLDKKFLSDIGLTVHQYIFDTKLDRAKRLLLKTSNSTDVIALSCGYPSQSYFYQVFKRVVGVTPVEFRNKIQITKSHVG